MLDFWQFMAIHPEINTSVRAATLKTKIEFKGLKYKITTSTAVGLTVRRRNLHTSVEI